MAEPEKIVDFTGGEEPDATGAEAEEGAGGWSDLLGSGKLKKKVLKKGTGERPEFGQEVLIHYKARPATGAEDIYLLDTRTDGGQPVTFRIGEGDIIAALDLVTALMNEGEVALIEAHSSLAYQHRGLAPHIAPNTDVVFEVEFVGVGKPPADLNDLLAQPKEKLQLVLQKKDRGNALFKVGDYEGAVKSYTQALKILRHKPEEGTQPPQPDISGAELTSVQTSLRDAYLAVCNNTCQALIKADQWAAAKEAAAEALTIDANNIKAVFRMAEIMMKGFGEHEEARQLYLKAQALDRKDPAIRSGLAQAVEGTKRAKESEKKLYQAMLGGKKDAPGPSAQSPSAATKKSTEENVVGSAGEKGGKLAPPQISVTADESDVSSPGTPRRTPNAKKERTGPAPLTPSEERKQGLVNMLAGIVITLMIVYLAYTLSGMIKVAPLSDEIEVAGGDFGDDASEHPHHEHTHSHDGDEHDHSHDEM